MDRNRFSWITHLLIGRRPMVTLIRACVLALICLVVFKFVFRPVVIDGESMAPTVRDRTFRFVNLLAYSSKEPQRGDIVVIEKDSFNTMYLKRIIGEPGETVDFTDGRLYIDGELVEEPYLHTDGDWDMQPVELGRHEYLVAGDNRTVARRQHVMGVVDRKYIQGKLLWR